MTQGYITREGDDVIVSLTACRHSDGVVASTDSITVSRGVLKVKTPDVRDLRYVRHSRAYKRAKKEWDDGALKKNDWAWMDHRVREPYNIDLEWAWMDRRVRELELEFDEEDPDNIEFEEPTPVTVLRAKLVLEFD